MERLRGMRPEREAMARGWTGRGCARVGTASRHCGPNARRAMGGKARRADLDRQGRALSTGKAAPVAYAAPPSCFRPCYRYVRRRMRRGGGVKRGAERAPQRRKARRKGKPFRFFSCCFACRWKPPLSCFRPGSTRRRLCTVHVPLLAASRERRNKGRGEKEGEATQEGKERLHARSRQTARTRRRAIQKGSEGEAASSRSEAAEQSAAHQSGLEKKEERTRAGKGDEKKKVR